MTQQQMVTPPSTHKYDNPPGFKPIRMMEVELGQALPAISSINPDNGKRYEKAVVLVRLYTQPIGLVELDYGPDGLSAPVYAQHIWEHLHNEINAHLRKNGFAEVTTLDANGLPATAVPPTLIARERFLANAPAVTVIVPTRERPDTLGPTLETLTKLDYPNYEVLVVDNAPSTSATEDLVKSRFEPTGKIRYLREDRPGVEWARNRGLLEVKGNFVAFTDDDVLVDKHWLTEMIMAFDTIDNVGCVTGVTIPAELEAPSQLWFEQYGGFNKGFELKVYDMREHRTPEFLYPYVAGKFGSGVNMAFRTEVIRALGGTDPALGTGSPSRGGGDIAAYLQVVTKGLRLVYTPGGLIHHFHRKTYEKLRKQMYSYGVGFSASLTKCLVDDPRLILDFATKVPYGLFVLIYPKSSKHKKKHADFPKELTYLELLGMAYGPIAFVRGRLRVQELQRRYGRLDVRTATTLARGT